MSNVDAGIECHFYHGKDLCSICLASVTNATNVMMTALTNDIDDSQ